MPYINDKDKQSLETGHILTPGQLNYMIHGLLAKYLEDRVLSYQAINDIMGVLVCVQAEFYRRLAAPYENQKIAHNGDVAPYPYENPKVV